MKHLGGVLLVFPLSLAAAETVRQYQDQETGLAAWEWRADGIQLQQIQRLPDQTRAFFQGRGFTTAEADQIAAHCVFQTIFHNHSAQPVTLDLAQWRVNVDGATKPPKLTADWQQDWQARNTPEAARIAFQWALFPNQQTFAPGDWNMGMITYPAPPNSLLDVQFSWQVGETRHNGVLRGLRCAADQSLNAEGNLQ